MSLINGMPQVYKLKKFIPGHIFVFTRFILLLIQPILLIFPILTAQLT
jgi:hypothetical protein